MTMPNQSLSKPASSVIGLLFVFCSAVLPGSAHAGIEFALIEKQARFAAAAYQSEAEISNTVRAEHYDLSLFHTLADIQMSFYLATSDVNETQVIAVRGTSNVENAMVDIALKLRDDELTGSRLHDGFAYASKKIYAELKPLLRPGYRIHTTGHSLGGAVALILAMYLDADGFNIEQVVTFGQPKVTNITGAKKLQHINVIRVVTPDDLVPLVPPFDPLDIRNIDIYWHVGTEVLLLEDNQYSVLDGADSMLRATKFTQKPLTEKNLQNHYMSMYLERVRAKLKSPEEVPYRNSFNLFNLFGSDQGS